MTLKNQQVGSFFYNLHRDPATTLNIMPKMTAGTVHLSGFGDTALTASMPGFVRFDGSTCYAIVDDSATRDAVIANADSFGLPEDFQDNLPLFVGIGEVTGGTDVTLLIAYTRPTTVTTTVVSGGALLRTDVLSKAAVGITKVLWIGLFVGQKRVAGVWDWTNSEYVDIRFL